jgi:two-component system, NtrC family, response regulator AtoC
MEKKTIFIVDDDVSVLKLLSICFAGMNFEVTQTQSGEKAFTILSEQVFDIVITDLLLGNVSGLDILKKVKETAPGTEVLVITGHSSIDSAVQAMKQGAYEYITKPIDIDELSVVVQKACERQRLVSEVNNLRTQIKQYFCLESIVAKSPAMQKIMELVSRIAVTNSTVLIEGESGTGKEVIARAIHNQSMRSGQPFVAINCGALPETLLESELFGYVKGAFTGAHAAKKGLFEEASGGTIFLDEIGETSPAFQVKLLRVLQENEIRRVGDIKDIRVDVRVLASSNNPIRQLVEEGRFRQDLYYRLRVIPLTIQPLRQRTEDIVPLAHFFIERYCKRTGKALMKLEKDAVKKIETHTWPGNVRELENTIERALILADTDVLTADNILIESYTARQTGYDFSSLSMKEMEKMHIKNMLTSCRWNQREAAQRLGIGYNTLWRKIKEYNIERL